MNEKKDEINETNIEKPIPDQTNDIVTSNETSNEIINETSNETNNGKSLYDILFEYQDKLVELNNILEDRDKTIEELNNKHKIEIQKYNEIINNYEKTKDINIKLNKENEELNEENNLLNNKIEQISNKIENLIIDNNLLSDKNNKLQNEIIEIKKEKEILEKQIEELHKLQNEMEVLLEFQKRSIDCVINIEELENKRFANQKNISIEKTKNNEYIIEVSDDENNDITLISYNTKLF